MAKRTGWGLALVILLATAAAELRGQLVVGDRPAPFVPARQASKQDEARKEARRLYGQGLVHQKQDRLLEALKALEEAARLDPEAGPVHRALIALYLALGRDEDALQACKKVLDNDPDDPETCYLYARQLKEKGKTAEAIAALDRGVACPSIKERLEFLVQMSYDLGLLCEEAKEYAKAEAALRAVVKVLVDKRQALLDAGPFSPAQLSGETAKTLERVGQVCIKAKQYDRAVTAFVEAQKHDPERAGRLNQNLAEVRLAQGKPDQALPFLLDYLKEQPAGAEAYEKLIVVLKELKREKELLPMLAAYAGRDPHNVALQLLAARQFGEARRWEEAERRFLKLAEDNPSPEVYKGLFGLWKDQKLVTKTLDLLDQTLAASQGKDDKEGDRGAALRARAMLAVFKDDQELVGTLLPVVQAEIKLNRARRHDTWRLLALLAARGGKMDAAENLYRSCLPTVTAQTEAEVYGGLLDVLTEARKHEEIIKVAREGLEKAQATNRVLFHIKLAPAYAALGKPKEAIQEADEAVKLASNDDQRNRFRRFRISVLAQCERCETAVQEGLALLKEATLPGDVRSARAALSMVYSQMQDHAKAEEQLRAILAMDPNDAGANNDLGYIMADQGKNLDESEKMIRKAIDLDREEKQRVLHDRKRAGVYLEDITDNAAYLDSLGWVLFRKGKHAEARDWLEKAAALPGGSDDPVMWDHLGDVYIRLELPDKARAAWEKSVGLYEKEKRRKMDDRYKEVKNKLQLLQTQSNKR